MKSKLALNLELGEGVDGFRLAAALHRIADQIKDTIGPFDPAGAMLDELHDKQIELPGCDWTLSEADERIEAEITDPEHTS